MGDALKWRSSIQYLEYRNFDFRAGTTTGWPFESAVVHKQSVLMYCTGHVVGL